MLTSVTALLLVGSRRVTGTLVVKVNFKSSGFAVLSVSVEPERLTIGALGERTGVAPSALRYYEAEGLIHADRSTVVSAATHAT